MTGAAWLSAAGLICDIIDAVILFRYGLPSKLNRLGERPFSGSPQEAELKKFKRFEFWSHIGLGLLIAGFGLQLVGTALPVLLPLLAKLTMPPAPVWVRL